MQKEHSFSTLQITDLTVHYEKRMAVQQVNFSIHSGQILGLIGPNGAGKTTLIRAISGVLHPVHGQIIYEGRDLEELTPAQRARIMAVVPQARSLPPAFTAWETVMLGRTPYLNWLGQTSSGDDEDVREAMRVTDTLDLAERRVGELSGGEQQRLLLARALAQGSPVLLLDEPITHLDLQYQVQFLELVKSLAGEHHKTILVALHDLNMVSRYADLVLLLVKGEQLAFGKSSIVLKEKVLSTAFNLSIREQKVGTNNIFLPD
jgi:ABC-type cobalamin/Fe3+-siderophores transport system ATPase subunit